MFLCHAICLASVWIARNYVVSSPGSSYFTADLSLHFRDLGYPSIPARIDPVRPLWRLPIGFSLYHNLDPLAVVPLKVNIQCHMMLVVYPWALTVIDLIMNLQMCSGMHFPNMAPFLLF